MTLDQLRLFRDIAHAQSLSRAAKSCEISQSAASQALDRLEDELGQPLVDRSQRPIRLTEAGEEFADFAREVLRRRDQLDVALERLRQSIDGTVRVASIYSVGLSEMDTLQREFRERLPNARIEVEYLRPEKVYTAVAEDRADLGLVSYPEPKREIQVIPWREEEMVVAASPWHPLAAKAQVEPGDLAGVAFISFDEELPIQRDINRYLKDRDVSVDTVFHFDNLQSVKQFVADRAGISIMPMRIMLNEIGQGRLVAIPFAKPDLFRPLGILHRKRKRFHRAAQVFLELLMQAPSPA